MKERHYLLAEYLRRLFKDKEWKGNIDGLRITAEFLEDYAFIVKQKVEDSLPTIQRGRQGGKE